ncbi:restriction endonuclease subunit S [Sarcina ventriculi]
MEYLKLGEISKFIMGQAPNSENCNKNGSGTIFVKAGQFGKLYPNIEEWTVTPLKLAKENDVLICVVGATVGKLNLAIDCAIGRSVAAIRCDSKKLHYKYLYYYLNTWITRIRELSQGSAIGVITKDMLYDLNIPMYDISSQIYIVNILDKAQKLMDKRKQQIEALDELVKSKFIEMFGDPVTNYKQWQKRKLIDECNIVTGNTPSRKVDEYYGNYIEWIKSDNITDSNIYLTKAREYLSEKGLQVGRYVEENSILMTCIAGSIKCIGNVAIANRKIAFNQQINAIEPLNNNVFFMFEQFRLSQQYIQSTINMSLKGILSKGQLSELEFIFPPIELQNQFADFVKHVDKLKLEMENSLKELEDNFNSLMQRAFKGELFN